METKTEGSKKRRHNNIKLRSKLINLYQIPIDSNIIIPQSNYNIGSLPLDIDLELDNESELDPSTKNFHTKFLTPGYKFKLGEGKEQKGEKKEIDKQEEQQNEEKQEGKKLVELKKYSFRKRNPLALQPYTNEVWFDSRSEVPDDLDFKYIKKSGIITANLELKDSEDSDPDFEPPVEANPTVSQLPTQTDSLDLDGISTQPDIVNGVKTDNKRKRVVNKKRIKKVDGNKGVISSSQEDTLKISRSGPRRIIVSDSEEDESAAYLGFQTNFVEANDLNFGSTSTIPVFTLSDQEDNEMILEPSNQAELNNFEIDNNVFDATSLTDKIPVQQSRTNEVIDLVSDEEFTFLKQDENVEQSTKHIKIRRKLNFISYYYSQPSPKPLFLKLCLRRYKERLLELRSTSDHPWDKCIYLYHSGSKSMEQHRFHLTQHRRDDINSNSNKPKPKIGSSHRKRTNLNTRTKDLIKDQYQKLSKAKRQLAKFRQYLPDSYFYHFTEPKHRVQYNEKWTEAEVERFNLQIKMYRDRGWPLGNVFDESKFRSDMVHLTEKDRSGIDQLKLQAMATKHIPNGWGIFSLGVPTRTGEQCQKFFSSNRNSYQTPEKFDYLSLDDFITQTRSKLKKVWTDPVAQWYDRITPKPRIESNRGAPKRIYNSSEPTVEDNVEISPEMQPEQQLTKSRSQKEADIQKVADRLLYGTTAKPNPSEFEFQQVHPIFETYQVDNQNTYPILNKNYQSNFKLPNRITKNYFNLQLGSLGSNKSQQTKLKIRRKLPTPNDINFNRKSNMSRNANVAKRPKVLLENGNDNDLIEIEPVYNDAVLLHQMVQDMHKVSCLFNPSIEDYLAFPEYSYLATGQLDNFLQIKELRLDSNPSYDNFNVLGYRYDLNKEVNDSEILVSIWVNQLVMRMNNNQIVSIEETKNLFEAITYFFSFKDLNLTFLATYFNAQFPNFFDTFQQDTNICIQISYLVVRYLELCFRIFSKDNDARKLESLIKTAISPVLQFTSTELKKGNKLKYDHPMLEFVVVIRMLLQNHESKLTYWKIVSGLLIDNFNKIRACKELEADVEVLWYQMFFLVKMDTADSQGSFDMPFSTIYTDRNRWEFVNHQLNYLKSQLDNMDTTNCGLEFKKQLVIVDTTLLRIHYLVDIWYWELDVTVLKGIFLLIQKVAEFDLIELMDSNFTKYPVVHHGQLNTLPLLNNFKFEIKNLVHRIIRQFLDLINHYIQNLPSDINLDSKELRTKAKTLDQLMMKLALPRRLNFPTKPNAQADKLSWLRFQLIIRIRCLYIRPVQIHSLKDQFQTFVTRLKQTINSLEESSTEAVATLIEAFFMGLKRTTELEYREVLESTNTYEFLEEPVIRLVTEKVEKNSGDDETIDLAKLVVKEVGEFFYSNSCKFDTTVAVRINAVCFSQLTTLHKYFSPFQSNLNLRQAALDVLSHLLTFDLTKCNLSDLNWLLQMFVKNNLYSKVKALFQAELVRLNTFDQVLKELKSVLKPTLLTLKFQLVTDKASWNQNFAAYGRSSWDLYQYPKFSLNCFKAYQITTNLLYSLALQGLNFKLDSVGLNLVIRSYIALLPSDNLSLAGKSSILNWARGLIDCSLAQNTNIHPLKSLLSAINYSDPTISFIDGLEKNSNATINAGGLALTQYNYESLVFMMELLTELIISFQFNTALASSADELQAKTKMVNNAILKILQSPSILKVLNTNTFVNYQDLTDQVGKLANLLVKLIIEHIDVCLSSNFGLEELMVQLVNLPGTTPYTKITEVLVQRCVLDMHPHQYIDRSGNSYFRGSLILKIIFPTHTLNNLDYVGYTEFLVQQVILPKLSSSTNYTTNNCSQPNLNAVYFMAKLFNLASSYLEEIGNSNIVEHQSEWSLNKFQQIFEPVLDELTLVFFKQEFNHPELNDLLIWLQLVTNIFKLTKVYQLEFKSLDLPIATTTTATWGLKLELFSELGFLRLHMVLLETLKNSKLIGINTTPTTAIEQQQPMEGEVIEVSLQSIKVTYTKLVEKYKQRLPTTASLPIIASYTANRITYSTFDLRKFILKDTLLNLWNEILDLNAKRLEFNLDKLLGFPYPEPSPNSWMVELIIQGGIMEIGGFKEVIEKFAPVKRLLWTQVLKIFEGNKGLK